MPVDTSQPEFSQDIVVHHFSGILTKGLRHFDFPNDTDNYYAICKNDGLSYDIGFQARAWLGSTWGSGSLYSPSIYNHITLAAQAEHGVSWYSYGYEGPRPGLLSIDVEPFGPDPLPFDIYVLTMGPRGGGDPGEPGEPCPPDPLWPYPDVLATSSAAKNGGVISHRRVLGGNRKQDIT